jgi:glutathione synthase/RimK-type ligase-like ATP-grasp enzyme
MKPKILLATTSTYYPAARLLMAMAEAGCAVDAVCPAAHPLRVTRAVRRAYVYRGLAPLHSFANAIAASKPDLIVPSDDLATLHLHALHARERRGGNSHTSLCAVIERSLGDAQSFPIVSQRSSFMDVAQQEGVRIPRTQALRNAEDLQGWIEEKGLPLVLKADGTSGGDGVKVIRVLAEAGGAFAKLHAPPLIARAVKHAVLDHDQTLLRPSVLRQRHTVNAQTFVAGREATSTVFCWQGVVLASLHFEVVNKASAAGHATVMRLIEHDEMSSAVERVVRRLGLSGFCGFDFMLEATTGNAYLIEINPRATQVGHLSLGPGRDLSAALFAALAGETPQPAPAPKVTEKDTIALFPQEWIRDPQSAFLQNAYHDVPWQEPALVGHCVSNREKQSGWYARLGRKQARAEAPSSIPERIAVRSTCSPGKQGIVA